MDTRDPEIKIQSWVRYEWLKQAPSLTADYKALLARYHPELALFDNVETYISDWKTFWKTAPHSKELPRFPVEDAKTSATLTYNMMIATFNPGNFKGVILRLLDHPA